MPPQSQQPANLGGISTSSRRPTRFAFQSRRNAAAISPSRKKPALSEPQITAREKPFPVSTSSAVGANLSSGKSRPIFSGLPNGPVSASSECRASLHALECSATVAPSPPAGHSGGVAERLKATPGERVWGTPSRVESRSSGQSVGTPNWFLIVYIDRVGVYPVSYQETPNNAGGGGGLAAEV